MPQPSSATAGAGTSRSLITVGGPVSAAEAADRKAAEKVWLDYHKASFDAYVLKPDTRRSTLAAFAIDPALSTTLAAIQQATSHKLEEYGAPVHHIRWDIPIQGKGKAVLKDCQDQREWGLYDTTNDTPVTRGAPNVNVQATMKRTDSGWRVQFVLTVPGGC